MATSKLPGETGAQCRQRLARDISPAAENEQAAREQLVEAALDDADTAYDYLSRLLQGLGVTPGVGLSMVATQVDSLLAGRIRENAELQNRLAAVPTDEERIRAATDIVDNADQAYISLIEGAVLRMIDRRGYVVTLTPKVINGQSVDSKADIEQGLTDTVPAVSSSTETAEA